MLRKYYKSVKCWASEQIVEKSVLNAEKVWENVLMIEKVWENVLMIEKVC